MITIMGDRERTYPDGHHNNELGVVVTLMSPDAMRDPFGFWPALIIY